MANLALTVASFSSAVNLQSTAVNPNAAPVATPRLGGFALRNRIKFGSLKSSAASTMGAISTSAATAVNYQLLEVPKRTILRNLTFATPPGASAVAHAFAYTTAVSSAHASTAKSGKWEIGVAAYKSASQKASSVKVDVDGIHASIAVTKKTGVIGTTFGLASASTPYNMGYAHAISAASSQRTALTFPYGGFVTMNWKAGSSAIASFDKSDAITGGAFTGEMEVQGNCDYIPE